MAVAASGVVMCILRFSCSRNGSWSPMYYSKHADVFIQTTDPVWFIIGDFVTVFVLAWVYPQSFRQFQR